MIHQFGSSRTTGALAVLFLFLASLIPAQAETQYVIVAAEPPGDAFEAGRVLAPGDVLTVPEGTVVTLLGEDGSVSAIPGPAEVAVTADSVTTGGKPEDGQGASRSTLSRLAALLAGERERAESLGVSRGIGDKPRPEGLDDPWALSIHESAPGCIRNGEVVLARKERERAIRLVFRIGSGEASEDLVWPSGDAKFTIDRKVESSEGELAVEAGKDFAKVDLRHFPPDVDHSNPVAVMGWMMDQGCNRQAVAFARGLARETQ